MAKPSKKSATRKEKKGSGSPKTIGSYLTANLMVGEMGPFAMLYRKHKDRTKRHHLDNLLAEGSEQPQQETKVGNKLFVMGFPRCLTRDDIFVMFDNLAPVENVEMSAFLPAQSFFARDPMTDDPGVPNALVSFESSEALEKCLKKIQSNGTIYLREIPKPSAALTVIDRLAQARGQFVPPDNETLLLHSWTFMMRKGKSEGLTESDHGAKKPKPVVEDGWTLAVGSPEELRPKMFQEQDPIRPDLSTEFLMPHYATDTGDILSRRSRKEKTTVGLYRFVAIAQQKADLEKIRRSSAESEMKSRNLLETGELLLP